MGTLFSQNPRRRLNVNKSQASSLIEEIKATAKKEKITFLAATKIYELLEYERRTNVMIDEADVKDEQMMGAGVLMKGFTSAIQEAFGVNQIGDAPKFLEKIAMALQQLADTHEPNNL